jgi:hypothetical protein
MSKRDRVWVGPELSDGNRPFIRENETGRQTGIMGDNPTSPPDSFVELEHVSGCCYDVTSEVKFTSAGPSQVATNAYREGWDRLFGKRREVGQA